MKESAYTLMEEAWTSLTKCRHVEAGKRLDVFEVQRNLGLASESIA